MTAFDRTPMTSAPPRAAPTRAVDEYPRAFLPRESLRVERARSKGSFIIFNLYSRLERRIVSSFA